MAGIGDQYGISKGEEKLLRMQAERRAEKRAYFLKELTNPHKHVDPHAIEMGPLFDPAVYRYQATLVKQYDYFKATPRTTRALALMSMPFLIFGYLVHNERSEREAKIRRGEVAYKDRLFKLV